LNSLELPICIVTNWETTRLFAH